MSAVAVSCLIPEDIQLINSPRVMSRHHLVLLGVKALRTAIPRNRRAPFLQDHNYHDPLLLLALVP
jgi:hypothetical protein